MNKDNGFSIEILVKTGSCGVDTWTPVHSFKTQGNLYFEMHDGEPYRVQLGNDRKTQADVKLKIDGKKVGEFRVYPHDSIIIERPAGKARQFVFVQEGSSLARQGGVQKGRQENGLIEARFNPEKYHRSRKVYALNESLNGSMNGSMNADMISPSSNVSSIPPSSAFSSGATVLGNESSQRFKEVENIMDIDHTNSRHFIGRMIAVPCEDESESPKALSQFNDHELLKLPFEERAKCPKKACRSSKRNQINLRTPPRIEDINTQHSIRNAVTGEVLTVPDVIIRQYPLDQYWIEPRHNNKTGKLEYMITSKQDEDQAIDRIPLILNEQGEPQQCVIC
ncbi:MAG: hypothetical protein Sylvanvirus27_4 [Sylvanvirus sp.]|uniref:Uncharacterized protein n=1 Tax=Sylvanvirus sp. TaxID=2487774 RepID=A0A3G5AIX7_9VIRU|nr:MAG: hypothetical protein Sylvanvirus27_4 [Sylvanvirus sp.]